ncbi:MAG: phosphoribosylformylglycinamidine cyclo-ligase [Chloroflexi bacterium]|nr:phosphoribosylformylglycinamidine cyclo-ligase [Chloroflexota bacterium]
MKHTYAGAGVNINAADRTKARLKDIVRTTFRPEVMTDIGHFGGMFRVPEGFKQPVLVSSVDGVGTKLKVAAAFGRFDTVGQDLVNHCVNDILCCGALPLFFLDYIAMGRLVPERVEVLVQGLATACKAQNCALVGGETAEMPGIYRGDDFDLAGTIIGVVEQGSILDGRSILPGDAVFGLSSSGLHTNGFSLARKVLARVPLDRHVPQLGTTLGDALLQIHCCYLPALKPALPLLKGLAHLTGGGFEGNIPRVLPDGTAVRLQRGSWPVPQIFRLIQEKGKVDESEMYRVFNMGIGMVAICAAKRADELLAKVPEARRIGEVVQAGEKGKPRVIFD